MRSTVKKITWYVIGFILILFLSILAILSTEWGNRFFFDRILSHQKMMTYEYKGGNLWKGVRLDHFDLKIKDIEIKADTAQLHLGWRALLSKEIHLFRANLNHLEIIDTAPPKDKPFDYQDINLPVNLRFNQLNVKELEIKTPTSTTSLHDIQIHHALWKGTKLSFKKAKVNLYDVFIQNAKGYIDFKQQGQYPLQLEGDVDLPALKTLRMNHIKVEAKGSLSHIQADLKTYTPDLLTAGLVILPMEKNVPMQGEILLKNYHLPFLHDEKLKAKQGVIQFKGNANGLDIELNTQLSGKHLPQGQYLAQMNTDFIHQLNIQNLTSDIMNGQIQLSGVVDWHDTKNIKWTVQSLFDHLNIPNTLLDENIRAFLPEQITGKLQSQGSLKDGVFTQNQIQFNNAEQWSVDYQQSDQAKEIPTIDVKWHNINRTMPYITGLDSPQGQAKIQLVEQKQIIDVKAELNAFKDSFLPKGQYETRLFITDERLDIPKLIYQLDNAQLIATAQVRLPSKRQKLDWAVKVNAEKFNPQLVYDTIPMDQITGSFEIKGHAQNATTQIIQTSNMNLIGRLADSLQVNGNQNLLLTGQSTIALLFNATDGAFQSYAIQHDGHLSMPQQASSVADGLLKLKLSGTPSYVNIQQFYHNGIAGQINAQGKLNLTHGIQWDIQSTLDQFKPHYFYAGIDGLISGQINTQGEWSDHKKHINIQQLNVNGHINQKPILGEGQLNLDLSQMDRGIQYSKFNANQLKLAYANNQIQISGNQNNMLMQIKAPNLSEFTPKLKGQIEGQFILSRQQRLQLNSQLMINHLDYNHEFSAKHIKLQGELPISDQIPSQLRLTMQDLSAAGRKIQQATVDLSGTYINHVLKISSQQPRSTFFVQFAGGFNQHRQWLGQMQQGAFQSRRMKLLQNHATNLVYSINQKSLKVEKHCWDNHNNQLCFDEDILISPEQANFSLKANHIYLQDLEAFIPDGLEITGQLNGYAKARWAKGQSPQLDMQLFTQNGVIGLASEQPNEESTVLAYDDLSLIAKTTADGLLIRSNMKTPSIGRGYAKVMIKPQIKGMPMSGEVAFDQIQLQVLRPFIDDVRQMSGTLSIAGKINGTLTKPEFYGDMSLKNGVFALNSLPVNLSNIELYMGIRQDIATINGTLNSGKGLAILSGKAAWGQQPYLRLKVKGDNLLIRQAPQIVAALDTDTNLEILPLQRKITVEAKTSIPRALINMPEQSPSAVDVSSDVRVVRTNQVQTVLSKAKAWDINAHIALTLGEQVIFQGFDARIPLAGKLDLIQHGQQIAMRAIGSIGSTRQVQISAYGQTLNLTKAIARFNGILINPSLDVNASKIVQGDTVGVRVLGTALSPNIQIYSNSGLSEQQALNALLTGNISDGISGSTSTDSFKSDVNNAVAAAGISMGLGGTRALTNQIGRAFGLSGLALDAQDSGDDTQVSLTGYITPDLYIRYGVGVFSNINKLSLRYQINKRLYLEASQDTERAIDLFYNWKF